MIDHIGNLKEEAWKGYFYVVLLFGAKFLSFLLYSHYFIQVLDVGTQIRSVLVSAIVRKSLKLSNSARQKFTTGEITNLISVDTQHVLDNLAYIHLLWGAPLQVILALILVYQELGIESVLIGCIGLILVMPPNIIGAKYLEKFEGKQLKAKDLRIKVKDQSKT